MMNDWIPISTGRYPRDGEVVQITYIGYYDKLPHCDAFAFRINGEWFFNNGEEQDIEVEITAWKKCCEPYCGE